MKLRIITALCAAFALMMCLGVTASAEIVGKTADGWIHRYIADNGQEIYFVSTGEEALVETDADVNFDGHPDLEVTFVTEAGRDFLSDLKDGQLDLALDMLPPQPLVSAAGSFVHVPLVRERQCVLMAKEDPRSGMETIALRDIHGCTIITGLEDSIEERMLKFICQKHGVTLNRFYRSDGIETNMRLLRNGKGVTLGPASFAAYYGVAAVPIEPELSTSLDFICLEKNADRPETAALRKFLVKLCAGRH